MSLYRGASHQAARAALLLATTSFAPTAGMAQALSADPFVTAVVGQWQGQGEDEGSPLTLTRSWTLELASQFLRADMRVGMANGSSFGALMYWSRGPHGAYEVLWMDGVGRRQTIHATRNPVTGRVVTTYLDELAEGGAEWRSWEFESLGPDSYVERLFRVSGAERELLTVFSFTRSR